MFFGRMLHICAKKFLIVMLLNHDIANSVDHCSDFDSNVLVNRKIQQVFFVQILSPNSQRHRQRKKIGNLGPSFSSISQFLSRRHFTSKKHRRSPANLSSVLGSEEFQETQEQLESLADPRFSTSSYLQKISSPPSSTDVDHLPPLPISNQAAPPPPPPPPTPTQVLQPTNLPPPPPPPPSTPLSAPAPAPNRVTADSAKSDSAAAGRGRSEVVGPWRSVRDLVARSLSIWVKPIFDVFNFHRSEKQRLARLRNGSYRAETKTLTRQEDDKKDLLDLDRETANIKRADVESNPSDSYLSSLYRFTDDGVRLSLVSRYDADYWTVNLVNMFRSRVFKRILPHLQANVLVSLGVAGIYSLAPGLPSLGGAVHTVTGSFLGLLIAFRTNTGYERYWEARRVWEDVQNRCRSMARLVATALVLREDLVFRVLQILTAFPFALKQHLRGQRNLYELRKVLSEEDMSLLSPAANMPLHLCTQLSVLIRPLLFGPASESPSESPVVWELCDQHLQDLIKAVGAAERLATTPVPLSYSRHTSRFLSVWSMTLPFFLVGYCGPWLSVPANAFVCWALFGTEEVGHIIEEPFGVPPDRPTWSPWASGSRPVAKGKSKPSENLPLLRYCEAIRRDMEEVARQFELLPTTHRVPHRPPEEVGHCENGICQVDWEPAPTLDS